MKTDEWILSAAIWINDGKIHKQQPVNIDIGYVVCGRRHHNCYQTICDVLGIDDVNKAIGNIIRGTSEEDMKKHQGFITSKNRYVDRTEGWKIALENDQVKYGKECTDDILISENLYFDEDE